MNGYGNDIKKYIEALKDRLLHVGEQADSETEQIADIRHDFEDSGLALDEDMKQIDKEIIERAKELGEYIFDEGYYDKEMNNFFAWNPDKIAKGEFPIEKIPEHVREIARSLYYN